MKPKTNSKTTKPKATKVVKDIRRANRKLYSAEEKIRIVIEGLRNVAAFSWIAFGKVKKRFRSALLKTGESSNIACSLLFKIFILGMAKSNSRCSENDGF